MKYLVLLLAVGLAAAIDLKGVKQTRHIYKRQAGQSFSNNFTIFLKQWFSPGTPVPPSIQTGRQEIAKWR